VYGTELAEILAGIGTSAAAGAVESELVESGKMRVVRARCWATGFSV
jgi:hypothetical protein